MINFSGLWGYVADVVPLVIQAEATIGPGNGTDKKTYVESMMKAITDLIQRFGGQNELDEQIKALRSDIIDAAVHLANYLGLVPSNDGKRLLAGSALGYVPPAVMAVYTKMQRGERPTRAEQELYDAAVEHLPAVPEHRLNNEIAAAMAAPPKRRSRKKKAA